MNSSSQKPTLEVIRGFKTLSWMGKSLLSTYNPLGEAKKWLKQNQFPQGVPLLIVGDVLGYHIQAALEEGHTSILALTAEEKFEMAYSFSSKKVQILPLSSLQLESKLSIFFENNGLHIWEIPILKPFYPEVFQEFQNRLIQFLKKKRVNDTVKIAFSKAWSRNSLNFFLQNSQQMGRWIWNRETPILIIAPGPSLEKIIPTIHHYRNRFLLVSLTSAGKILEGFDITPDFYFATDPGFYAKTLTFFLPPPRLGWILPPTAAFAPITQPIEAFQQGIEPQESFGGRHWKDSSFCKIDEAPSVSISAWHFFKDFKTKAFGGLDLSHNSGKNYSRGHDYFQKAHFHSKRFQPIETTFFSTSSTALNIFKEAFKNLFTKESQKLVRISAPYEEDSPFIEVLEDWFENLPLSSPPAFKKEETRWKQIQKDTLEFIKKATAEIHDLENYTQFKTLSAAVKALALPEAIKGEREEEGLVEFKRRALKVLQKGVDCGN